MSEKGFYDNKKRNQGDIIFEELKTSIIKNTIKPGEHIVERNLVTQFGSSRTPIREALHKLEKEGLVTTIPNKGVFVSSFTLQDIKSIYGIRAVLEAYAYRLAIQKLSEEQLYEIKKMHEELMVVVNNYEFIRAFEINTSFHRIVFESCEDKHLLEMINLLWVYVQRIRSSTFSVAGRSNQVIEEHRKIVEALFKRDEAQIEIAMRIHVESALSTLVKGVQEGLIVL